MTFALISIFVIGSNEISAQFPITIPKIPKIKKPKVKTPEPEQTTSTATDGKTTVQDSTANTETEDDEMDFCLTFFLEEIAKTQKSVEKYNPDDYLC